MLFKFLIILLLPLVLCVITGFISMLIVKEKLTDILNETEAGLRKDKI